MTTHSGNRQTFFCAVLNHGKVTVSLCALTVILLVYLHETKYMSLSVSIPQYQQKNYYHYNNLTTKEQREYNIAQLFNAIRCVRMLRPVYLDIRKDTWQAQKVTHSKDREDVVFSMHAYYDDRLASTGHHFLRLFIVMESHSWQAFLTRGAFCYLWREGCINPEVVKATLTNLDREGFQIVVNRKAYNNILMTCAIPEELNYNVSHVSFNTESCGGKLQTYLPITYIKNKGTHTHTFGQCNANGISFGYMGEKEARWMVEWMELNMLFGITEFNLYNGTMQTSAKYQKVLDYYQNKGILRLYHQVPPITKVDPSKRYSADIAMRTGFNDCMYRNMYRYKYIVSIDLDEIIVPLGRCTNYSQIMQKLHLKQIATVIFSSQAFFQSILNQPQNVSAEFDLISSRFINSVFDQRKKHFINPRLCLVGYSHKCMYRFQSSFDIDFKATKKLGEVHHYRNQCMKEGETSEKQCTQKQESLKENRNIQRYVTKHFYKRVSSIWNNLNI